MFSRLNVARCISKQSQTTFPTTLTKFTSLSRSHRHSRSLPGPPAAAWFWTEPGRRWAWGRDRGSVRGSGWERRPCSRRDDPQMICAQRGWHGDSVGSTIPSERPAACPSWHSGACGLNGNKQCMSVWPTGVINANVCVSVCDCVSPRASALGLLEEMVRVTMRWEREESGWTRVGQWALSFRTLLRICITSEASRTGLEDTWHTSYMKW